MAIDRQPSCDDVNEDGLLPVSVARARLAERIIPIGSSEQVGVRESLNRVCAEPVSSPIDVPAYTNSAMDGYAVAASDMPAQGERTLPLAGTVWAGTPLGQDLAAGHAVRIMTGGMMPAGTDTVIIQEHVEATENSVTIDGSTPAGRNVRKAGEDIRAGEQVIEAGTLITPAHVGLMASLGIDGLSVVRKPRVAYFSTGDELRALETHAGQTLGDGELFDSNRHTIFAMLARMDVELIDMGLVPDNPQATRDVFEDAASRADLIISSGGVSAGAADFVSDTLAELGDVSFWKLAMRPGRPLAFGQVGDAHFFGLPGNPVAVMVTFYEFVKPALLRLMGVQHTEPFTVSANSAEPIRKSPGRVEYQRGILQIAENGQAIVRLTGKQGAGRLSSMCQANCLIVLPPESDGIKAGDTVQVHPFHGLV
jgi:molybdopterin molybdotransferase